MHPIASMQARMHTLCLLIVIMQANLVTIAMCFMITFIYKVLLVDSRVENRQSIVEEATLVLYFRAQGSPIIDKTKLIPFSCKRGPL